MTSESILTKDEESGSNQNLNVLKRTEMEL